MYIHEFNKQIAITKYLNISVHVSIVVLGDRYATVHFGPFGSISFMEVASNGCQCLINVSNSVNTDSTDYNIRKRYGSIVLAVYRVSIYNNKRQLIDYNL